MALMGRHGRRARVAWKGTRLRQRRLARVAAVPAHHATGASLVVRASRLLRPNLRERLHGKQCDETTTSNAGGTGKIFC